MAKHILCVCKDNRGLSPVLAAVLQRVMGDKVSVASAGVEKTDGQPAAPEWEALQAETGIDLRNHRSRHIGKIGNLSQFDYIICTDPTVVSAVKLLGVDGSKILLANEPDGIFDTGNSSKAAYETCYPEILRAAADLIAKIR